MTELAKNYHAVLGDINTEPDKTPPESWKTHKLITERNAVSTLAILFSGLDTALAELQWALGVLAGAAPARPFDGPLAHRIRAGERTVKRSEKIFEVLSERFFACTNFLQISSLCLGV